MLYRLVHEGYADNGTRECEYEADPQATADAELGELVRRMPRGVTLAHLDNGWWRIERVSYSPQGIQPVPEAALAALGEESDG